MAAIEAESGANRALVSYYFGGKAGLVAALVDGVFQDPGTGLVETIRDEAEGPARTQRLLDWQERVSAHDRVNRQLYELLPQALRDPAVRQRFADEYRLYRRIDAECLDAAPADLDDAEALAAVTIAVVEGLAIQRALDPDGFDHARAWRAWRAVIDGYLRLSQG
jgi:AcrR family transcriptional regulator